jgi:hypothetical protein
VYELVSFLWPLSLFDFVNLLVNWAKSARILR